MKEMFKNPIIKTLLFSSVLLFVMGTIPLLIALGKGGVQTDIILNKLFFYGITSSLFLFGIIILSFVEHYILEKDNIYGNSLMFYSPGESPALEIKSKLLTNPIYLFIIVFIITAVIFLFTNVYNQQIFTGTVRLEQQFTKTDELWFNFSLIPIAENLIPAFAVAFLITFWRIFCRKKNINKLTFQIVSFFITVFFFTAVWFIVHQSRYAGNDVAIMNVIIFGLAMGLLTAITGSFIPAWILHANNNFFIEVSKLYSNDNILVFTIITLLILLFSFLFMYFKKKKNKVEV